jgi:DNA-binding LacI/PurR family transcriptional regulator
MARVTLQTIADRVGVSRMTVSNAFSRPDQLSADMRRTILAAAADLGYVGPDPSARALARGTTGAVGVLLTNVLGEALTDEIAMTFLASIADELAPTGRAMTLLSATPSSTIVPARDVAMDGALVYSCDPDSTVGVRRPGARGRDHQRQRRRPRRGPRRRPASRRSGPPHGWHRDGRVRR